MQAVLAYLEKVDPDAARRARTRYACFDRFGDEIQEYAHANAHGLAPSCEREVVTQLLELHRRRADYASRDGRVAADEFFFAEQNARLVRNAEEYYRTMFRGHVESWNLRDQHMSQTLDELMQFLERARPGARIVVWAHNSHLGDARATEMGQGGELNVGQLVRERFGAQAILVGFTTYAGTVTAASEWDGPAHRKHVRPALAGSYERLFHEAGIPRLLLPLRTDLRIVVGAGRSTSRTRHRRHLCAADRAPKPLFSRAASRDSSTTSSISTKPARSNRSNERRCGKRARWLKRFLQGCKSRGQCHEHEPRKHARPCSNRASFSARRPRVASETSRACRVCSWQREQPSQPAEPVRRRRAGAAGVRDAADRSSHRRGRGDRSPAPGIFDSTSRCLPNGWSPLSTGFAADPRPQGCRSACSAPARAVVRRLWRLR